MAHTISTMSVQKRPLPIYNRLLIMILKNKIIPRKKLTIIPDLFLITILSALVGCEQTVISPPNWCHLRASLAILSHNKIYSSCT